ncbi:KH domain-containing protein [bacterium]|nr:KH domain-containing protein [bacterium]
MSVVEYTEFLIKKVVKNSDMVKVEAISDDLIEVLVPNEEMKYVIGKNGDNIKAIRTLVNAFTFIQNLDKVNINVEAF